MNYFTPIVRFCQAGSGDPWGASTPKGETIANLRAEKLTQKESSSDDKAEY